MNASPIAKAWYLLLAAHENMRTEEPRFFALPCETLDDLATQLALHARPRRQQQPS